MASKFKSPRLRSGRFGEVLISGTITVGASGAVSSSSSECATVVKTASEAGRYTLSLDRVYKNVRPVGAPTIIGPTDNAFGNTAANTAQYRNVGVVTNGVQTVDVQLFLASSGVDTETTSGNVVCWTLAVQE